MLLLNLYQPSLVQLLTYASGPLDPKKVVTNSDVAVVLTLAMIGATFHGVAMALRKYYGEGHAQYYMQWKWWVGALVDGCAGCMIWPAMHVVSVQILAPIIIVVQLGASYTLGTLVFDEKSSLHHSLGLAFAITGVIGISMSTSHQAAPFPIGQFWAAWVTPHFIIANVFAFSVLAAAGVFGHSSTFWALAAAITEGYQYISSRAIVESIFDFKLNFLEHPSAMAAILLKVSCITLSLHFQQHGLTSDLSKFAGMFCVSCTVFMCIYGTAFFGEKLHTSPTFIASSLITLAGIWLLNMSVEIQASEDEASQKSDKEGKDVESRDDDSIYEGEGIENIEPEQVVTVV